MSNSATLDCAPGRGGTVTAPWGFVCAALGTALAAAILAGWAPLRFSIVTVFLFAGPHNWLEFRYFLTRLPARWGRLRGFFLMSFAGIFGLTAAFAALWSLVEHGALGDEIWEHGFAVLNSLLLLWIAALVHLRSRQNPRREWGWIWPVAFALIAVAWLAPPQWGLLLVYLHPLMAFWLLDRELRRSRPHWRPAFHLCLACLPLFLFALWWRLADAPPLPGDDELTRRITSHAGAGVVPFSTHLLVSTHTFLEMLHYGVWILAIPLIGLRAAPWRLHTVPMARRSSAWRWGVVAFLGAGLAVVVVLWSCFLADYTTTRTVYFVAAMAHVYAEVPFLLRAL
jgi:hypothetical protein